MTIETHNWASSAHQELHKIVRDEIFPIVNQVDARLQNFEIQFLKEAAKFVGDFKSLKNEADASLAKHKALELEIERLLKAVVRIDNTKTRRPQPRSNTKNDRDVISKVVCAMCKKCLISVNHDKYLSKNVNGKNSYGKNRKAKVSVKEIQKKYHPKASTPKKVGTRESLATPKPRKSRLLL
nr:hypothetical protein [Tanacetum cinerariifolium]